MSEQTKSRSASQGTLLWRISKKFNFAAEKIIPDSFVFCVILMLAVFVLSLLLCGKSPLDLLIAWWNGLSSQFTLAFQMGLMVIVTSTCARSPQAAKLLNKIASLVNTRTAALIVLMIFGYVTSMLNWAFCTIVTPILAMHLAKRIKGLHFPMMVAGGYSCMILGQCLGPSATLYSNLATEGSSYAEIVGQSMSVAETCYNPMNIILWVVLAVVFILLVLFTRPGEHELVELGKSHTIRILNDKRVAVGYIYTGFDKRCADKHIYLALDKPSPYIEKLFLAHSSVCYPDIRFGYHRMNICGAGIYAFNAVVDIVNLSVAAKLLIYRLCYNSSVMLDNVCGYRVTVAGRSFNDAHIPYSRHRHI